MNRRATTTRILPAALALTAMATLAAVPALPALPAAVASAPTRVPAASSGDATEWEVKAAFLYNFAFFTTWPDDAFPSADAPLVVAVVGADPFGAKLDATMKDKKIKGHPIVVERYATAEKIGKPHVLFAGGHDDDKLAAARIACRDRAIVLVGDCPGFCSKGGVANFFIENSKVRFEMNLGAAKRARLQLSSQLLKLAKIVEGS